MRLLFPILAVTFILTACHLLWARAASLRMRTAPETGEQTAADDDKQLSREKRMIVDLVGFLQQYGYMPLTESENGEAMFFSEATLTEAIRGFQKFNGLPLTGDPDEQTIRKMLSPRCGFPDVVPDSSRPVMSSDGAPQPFTTLGTRWHKNTLTWKPVKFSSKLPESEQWKALESGLKHWSEVAPLNFQYTSGEADIDILFVRGDHGDGVKNQFDGPGRVLAHAYQPAPGMGGDVHLDEEENWSTGTGSGTDLETVAAHELGHALGLGHSELAGALMAPYYKYSPNLQLHVDDIRAIQSLYGSRTSLPATSSTTSTTTISTTTQTTESPATTTQYSPDKPYCGPNFHIDAITGGPDGFKYIFRQNSVYRVSRWGLESDFPRAVDQVFKGGPKGHLLAAVYIPETNQHYLFKSAQYWRFTNFLLDKGYPRDFTTQHKPSAALTFQYGYGNTRIFMFGNTSFWEWDPVTEHTVAGYPLSTDVYWRGAPGNPDAAIDTNDGYTFFFKGNKYYKLRHRVSVSEPKPLGPDWFGQTCRASLTSINEANGLRDLGTKDVKPVVSDGEKTRFDLSPVPSLPSQFAHLAVKGGLRNKHH